MIRLRSFGNGFLARGTLAASIVLVASAAVVAACVGDDPSTGSTSDDGGSGSDGNTTSNDGSTGTDGNTTSDSATPDAGPSVVDVAFGFSSAAALLSDGTVWAWGDDGTGNLGVSGVSLPTVATCSNCRPTPAQIPGLTNIRQVSIGQQSCAVDNVGDVYCWGSNDVGQTGHDPGTNGDSTCPAGGSGKCTITPTKVAGLSSVTKVLAGGDGASCALTSGHSVYCWGSNQALNLAEADASVVTSSPTLISGLSGKTITDISMPLNGTQVCAVAQGEGVYCWGDNSNGESGHSPGTEGDISALAAPFGTPQPTIVSPTVSPAVDSTDIVSLAAGQATTCGLTLDGGVKCWGDNEYGQFANGGVAVGSVGASSILPANIVTMTSISGRSGNYEYSFCGLTANNDISCWGASDYGQLGNGWDNLIDGGADHDAGPTCANDVHCATTPLAVSIAMKFTKVSAGFFAAAALGTDGKVYAWGFNGNGQLGHTPLTNGDDGACVDVPLGNPTSPCNPRPTVVVGLP